MNGFKSVHRMIPIRAWRTASYEKRFWLFGSATARIQFSMQNETKYNWVKRSALLCSAQPRCVTSCQNQLIRPPRAAAVCYSCFVTGSAAVFSDWAMISHADVFICQQGGSAELHWRAGLRLSNLCVQAGSAASFLQLLLAIHYNQC